MCQTHAACSPDQPRTYSFAPDYAEHLTFVMTLASDMLNAFLEASSRMWMFLFGKTTLYDNCTFEDLMYAK
jgi:hypothetical protein